MGFILQRLKQLNIPKKAVYDKSAFYPGKRHITSGLAKWRSEWKPEALLRPLTVCDNSGCVALHPPLRQAAGRYATYALLRWNIESIFLNSLNFADIIY